MYRVTISVYVICIPASIASKNRMYEHFSDTSFYPIKPISIYRLTYTLLYHPVYRNDTAVGLKLRTVFAVNYMLLRINDK